MPTDVTSVPAQARSNVQYQTPGGIHVSRATTKIPFSKGLDRFRRDLDRHRRHLRVDAAQTQPIRNYP